VAGTCTTMNSGLQWNDRCEEAILTADGFIVERDTQFLL